jgi:hypothetical protein
MVTLGYGGFAAKGQIGQQSRLPSRQRRVVASRHRTGPQYACCIAAELSVTENLLIRDLGNLENAVKRCRAAGPQINDNLLADLEVVVGISGA